MEHDSGHADRRALDRGEEQRPIGDHQHAGRERGCQPGTAQPQLAQAAAGRAPRQQRQRAEHAAEPDAGQRVLASFLDEHADGAEQQAAGDHQHHALALARRRR
jgi:hypothetical protein